MRRMFFGKMFPSGRIRWMPFSDAEGGGATTFPRPGLARLTQLPGSGPRRGTRPRAWILYPEGNTRETLAVRTHDFQALGLVLNLNRNNYIIIFLRLSDEAQSLDPLPLRTGGKQVVHRGRTTSRLWASSRHEAHAPGPRGAPASLGPGERHLLGRGAGGSRSTRRATRAKTT